jgi:hypothetical protein
MVRPTWVVEDVIDLQIHREKKEVGGNMSFGRYGHYRFINEDNKNGPYCSFTD